MVTEVPTAPVYYGQVQQILRRACVGSAADYGGLGAFWELPLDQFLVLRLMGLPLVEPAAGGCCASAATAGSRATRSSLVKGLRGEAPFDGTRFPRLPWGAAPLADQEIDLIAGWIDDGCPGDPVAELAVAGAVIVRESARVELTGPAGPMFPVLNDANAYLQQKSELKQRMDIDCMSEAQIDRLRQAFRALYELNKWPEDRRSYNNLALIHQNHCQHGWERFLPWHRVYLYEFEQALQDHCPEVTMPYWDFPAPQYKPENPAQGERIPPALQAFLDPAALATLAAKGVPADALKDMLGKRYATSGGLFAAVKQRIGDTYVQGRWRELLIDVLLESNALWYPLRYPGEYGEGQTINTAIHYHYPSAQDVDAIMSLRTFRDFGGGGMYNDSFGFVDQNPHNTMHIWTGGINPDAPAPVPGERNRAVQVAGRKFHQRSDLYGQPAFGDMFSNLTASYDPVFWPVHSNLDRWWWNWQQRNPDARPMDMDAVLTPWGYAMRDTLDMHRFGYEYVRSSYVMPVGLSSPVGRFRSAPIEIPDRVRKQIGGTEVRLHRVPQLPRSCFIRAFLNVPDADAATPLTHPGYAGYAVVFGHGDCIGGPGHCAVPETQGRRYDQRQRSMNTPRNHRIDVSQCMRRLLMSGAKTVEVTLVVIGASYQEDRELLRLDGVSLNFLD